MSEKMQLVTGDDSRLLVGDWENAQGRRLVTIAPQYRDRTGVWKLSHSGLILTPEAARSLGPVLAAVAAQIDGAPVDPMPTDQDRDDSRMP